MKKNSKFTFSLLEKYDLAKKSKIITLYKYRLSKFKGK